MNFKLVLPNKNIIDRTTCHRQDLSAHLKFMEQSTGELGFLNRSEYKVENLVYAVSAVPNEPDVGIVKNFGFTVVGGTFGGTN